ncbi:MAG: hypothetical protein JXD23_13090 [Spirochaetales bacterium]|nr:hypothetical protein [Spirochaetales bacterium]
MKKILVFLTIIAVAFLFNSCSLMSIMFEVTGPAPTADIIYQFNTTWDNLTDVSLPWTMSFTGSSGKYCDLFALSTSGIVTVTIYRDGVPIETETSGVHNYVEVNCWL